MRIKVCGLREPANIAAVCALPVDFIGFIFYPPSPRYVDPAVKLDTWLRRQATVSLGGIAKVGVFVNAAIEEVVNAIHDYQLDYVQLHGEESPEYCQELEDLWSLSSIRRASIIKAFSVDAQFDFQTTAAYTAYCKYFIFDTKGAGYGGTGQSFDWALLDRYLGVTPFLLSGGIGPTDVTAIRQLQHPQLSGVDLNSRFESVPGEKDVTLLEQFIRNLNQTQL